MKALHCQHWATPAEPRASVLLLHGLGEHGARHAATATWLAAQGIEVYAPDLPGHGRSAGRRGDSRSLMTMLVALQPIWDQLNPARPRFLFGHSFGGLLAVPLALQLAGQVQALLLSSPFFEVDRPPARWRRWAAKLLLRLAPGLPLPTGLDATALAHDPAVVKDYRADPLVHDRLSARLYGSALAVQAQLPLLAPRLQLPVLLWHGNADRLTSCAASRNFASRLTDVRSKFIEIDNGFHELLFDFEAASLRSQIWQWLEPCIGTAAGP